MYITVFGFTLLGLVIPELLNVIGGGGCDIPVGQNIACAVCFGCISGGLLL